MREGSGAVAMGREALCAGCQQPRWCGEGYGEVQPWPLPGVGRFPTAGDGGRGAASSRRADTLHSWPCSPAAASPPLNPRSPFSSWEIPDDDTAPSLPCRRSLLSGSIPVATKAREAGEHERKRLFVGPFQGRRISWWLERAKAKAETFGVGLSRCCRVRTFFSDIKEDGGLEAAAEKTVVIQYRLGWFLPLLSFTTQLLYFTNVYFIT